MINLIGIMGKSQSGKDTTGKVIQYLTWQSGLSSPECEFKVPFEQYCNMIKVYEHWEIHKFADALKEIVCILIGCKREQLEDNDFKNSYLSKEWNETECECLKLINKSYCYKYITEGCHFCHKNKTSLKTITVRELLQKLGTDLLRNQLHENTWTNALFSKYKEYDDIQSNSVYPIIHKYPNWIITDVRFPNEVDAIKSRGGILLRCNRKIESTSNHISETALDNYTPDYELDNNGTVENLIEQVKQILIKEHIL